MRSSLLMKARSSKGERTRVFLQTPRANAQRHFSARSWFEARLKGEGKLGEKVIGILGGMGPEATLDCFEKIIRNTPAGKDQDHLRVIIDSNTKLPDRTPAILGKGASLLPLLVQGCRPLHKGGAH